MPTYQKKRIGDLFGFEKPIEEIAAEVPEGGALKILDPIEYITDRQRRWYKGICLRDLVKNDENGETESWWDDEVKRECNGLGLLKQQIFFYSDQMGNKIGIGRLTTRNVGKRNMTAFIEQILSVSLVKGWDIAPPDPDLRK